MAQIREFTSTTESYFILDGVSYPKVYEAMLDSGYSDTKIKLVGTNRDTAPLVFSTEYTNILVDGDDFDTASEAISRLNQVVFSKGGGSGDGGTGIVNWDSIQNKPEDFTPSAHSHDSIINQNGGSLKLWTGTQFQYDELTKDSTTLYFII